MGLLWAIVAIPVTLNSLQVAVASAAAAPEAQTMPLPSTSCGSSSMCALVASSQPSFTIDRLVARAEATPWATLTAAAPTVSSVGSPDASPNGFGDSAGAESSIAIRDPGWMYVEPHWWVHLPKNGVPDSVIFDSNGNDQAPAPTSAVYETVVRPEVHRFSENQSFVFLQPTYKVRMTNGVPDHVWDEVGDAWMNGPVEPRPSPRPQPTKRAAVEEPASALDLAARTEAAAQPTWTHITAFWVHLKADGMPDDVVMDLNMEDPSREPTASEAHTDTSSITAKNGTDHILHQHYHVFMTDGKLDGVFYDVTGLPRPPPKKRELQGTAPTTLVTDTVRATKTAKLTPVLTASGTSATPSASWFFVTPLWWVHVSSEGTPDYVADEGKMNWPTAVPTAAPKHPDPRPRISTINEHEKVYFISDNFHVRVVDGVPTQVISEHTIPQVPGDVDGDVSASPAKGDVAASAQSWPWYCYLFPFLLLSGECQDEARLHALIAVHASGAAVAVNTTEAEGSRAIAVAERRGIAAPARSWPWYCYTTPFALLLPECQGEARLRALVAAHASGAAVAVNATMVQGTRAVAMAERRDVEAPAVAANDPWYCYVPFLGFVIPECMPDLWYGDGYNKQNGGG